MDHAGRGRRRLSIAIPGLLLIGGVAAALLTPAEAHEDNSEAPLLSSVHERLDCPDDDAIALLHVERKDDSALVRNSVLSAATARINSDLLDYIDGTEATIETLRTTGQVITLGVLDGARGLVAELYVMEVGDGYLSQGHAMCSSLTRQVASYLETIQ